MKRTVIQAAVFGVCVLVMYYAVQIGTGMYLTMTYVPDVIKQYETAGQLQSQVSFGYMSGSLNDMWELVLLFIAGMALFTMGKLVYMKLRK